MPLESLPQPEGSRQSLKAPSLAALGIFEASLITKPQWDPGFLRSRVHFSRGGTTVARTVAAFDQGLIRNLVGSYSSHVHVLS